MADKMVPPVGKVRLRLILEDDAGQISETEVEVKDGEDGEALERRVIRALPKVLKFEFEMGNRTPVTFGEEEK